MSLTLNIAFRLALRRNSWIALSPIRASTAANAQGRIANGLRYWHHCVNDTTVLIGDLLDGEDICRRRIKAPVTAVECGLKSMLI
jgi:hypothetical protein